MRIGLVIVFRDFRDNARMPSWNPEESRYYLCFGKFENKRNGFWKKYV